MFEDVFLDMMPLTCFRQIATGKNDYGEDTFGSQIAVRCRVTYKPTLVRRGTTGFTSGAIEEVISSAQISTPPTGWLATDRITLPNGTTPLILSVEKYMDCDGVHHETVMV